MDLYKKKVQLTYYHLIWLSNEV